MKICDVVPLASKYRKVVLVGKLLQQVKGALRFVLGLVRRNTESQERHLSVKTRRKDHSC